MRRTTLNRLAICSLAVLSLGLPAGCNIVAGAFYIVHGPEKVKKRYTLPEERPTVVFIDDRANRVPRRSLRIAMAEQAERTLLEEGAVDELISFQSAMLVASQDRPDDPISITDIGRGVGAEIVIYATIDQFSLTSDGSTFEPVASIRIKVLDVSSDTRLWPPDQTLGESVVIRIPFKQGISPSSGSERMQAEQELAVRTGLGLAQLFYTHEQFQTVLR